MNSNYQRNGRVAAPASPAQQPEEAKGEDGAYRVHGFQQVIEMLKIADDEFRISLLRRLERAEPELARQLKIQLRRLGII